MTSNYHLRNIILLVLLLVVTIGISFWAYTVTSSKPLLHLSAVFLEVLLTILIIDLYLASSRRRESFRIYSLARTYIFEEIFEEMFIKFNFASGQQFERRSVIDQLGNYPSFHKKLVRSDYFRKIAKQTLDEMTDEQLLQMIDIIYENFPALERSADLNIAYQNEDLFSSLIACVDNAFMIRKTREQGVPDHIIVDAVRNHKILLNQTCTLRETVLRFIRIWLYIINNFIYFSDISNTFIKQRLYSTNAPYDSDDAASTHVNRGYSSPPRES